ncbi:MAG: dienelactone hydrolase family protein [Blastochloris viridis]|uniref:Dienelactone hydrolase family protein n=1 Tax=Blastochloris viridis TaxID=1079 RepID=A0A6N4R3X9_BLAVI|nr:MAG: dienelactone hydrolase family protein [Blastochloris viridis]
MEMVTLTTGTGKEFVGHVARPQGEFAGEPKGCVVVLHEAFGVTAHIKRVCEDFAGQGYVAIAPAMLAFALGTPEGVVLPINKKGLDEARRLIEATERADILGMLEACIAWGRGQKLNVALCGYCWGGSVAYMGASHLKDVAACVSYYGGQLAKLTAEAQPTCATLIHLAEQDQYIPLDEAVEALKRYHPAAQVQVYEADHGFNRDDGVTYDPGVALVARRLTLDVIQRNM